MYVACNSEIYEYKYNILYKSAYETGMEYMYIIIKFFSHERLLRKNDSCRDTNFV